MKGSHSAHLPIINDWKIKVGMVCVFVVMGTMGLNWVMDVLFGYRYWPDRWPTYGAIVIVGGLLVYSSWWKQRLRRRAKALGGMMCGTCGYALPKDAETGMCPECGQFFDAESLRRLWFMW